MLPSALAPLLLLLVAGLFFGAPGRRPGRLLRLAELAALGALALTVAGAARLAAAGPAALGWGSSAFTVGLQLDTVSAVIAVLVSFVGWIVVRFSRSQLDGEAREGAFHGLLLATIAAVLVLVQAASLSVLVASFVAVGLGLHRLLLFYPERPAARRAAAKFALVWGAGEVALILAAGLLWAAFGTAEIGAIRHAAASGLPLTAQLGVALLVLAALLKTAAFPLHGWLTEVMEAPTPVSALLHAGIINAGGVLLIRFAELVQASPGAMAALVLLGGFSALFGALVMLTQSAVKTALAWSTVAQMGFMLLECGLGLYTLAALHLVGHSLYKAHVFLSASNAVRQARLQAMHSATPPTAISLALAPVAATATVLLVLNVAAEVPWPAWWSAVLGLAWAPLLWSPQGQASAKTAAWHSLAGLVMVAGLTAAAVAIHHVPLGLRDAPAHVLGWLALIGLLGLYLFLALLQRQPHMLRTWRRWSYAGFYIDEAYTRLALYIWPTAWTPPAPRDAVPHVAGPTLHRAAP